MGRIAGRFGRVEPRRRARAFVLGLLSGLPRKNCWSIAEYAGDPTPGGMQHLLGRARWDADAVRDDLRAYLTEPDAGGRAAVRSWRSRPGSLLGYLEEQGVLGGASSLGDTGRDAGGALSPVAGDRPRAGRGHGAALCEACAVVSESASGRAGRAGKSVRNRCCRVLAGRERAAQHRLGQGPRGRAALAAEISVSAGPDVAAAGRRPSPRSARPTTSRRPGKASPATASRSRSRSSPWRWRSSPGSTWRSCPRR